MFNEKHENIYLNMNKFWKELKNLVEIFQC